MVLIGGKNGAGKTTLFNAIKICLYGCVAYGFESNNAKYFAEIRKLSMPMKNAKNWWGRSCHWLADGWRKVRSHIHVCQIMEGSRQENSRNLYCVQRRRDTFWDRKEWFWELSFTDTAPNLFRFYFFDGEKIGDFVFNSSKNSDFKDAFLKLCSLDTMEIIRENFRRISRSKAKGTMTLSAETIDALKQTIWLHRE